MGVVAGGRGWGAGLGGVESVSTGKGDVWDDAEIFALIRLWQLPPLRLAISIG